MKEEKGTPHELKYRISFTTERKKCKIITRLLGVRAIYLYKHRQEVF
jgi:hypothetical protein